MIARSPAKPSEVMHPRATRSERAMRGSIAQVASWLQVQGIRLAEVRIVPDVPADPAVLRFLQDLPG